MRRLLLLLLCLPTLLAAQAPEPNPEARISDVGLRIADSSLQPSNPQPSNLQPSNLQPSNPQPSRVISPPAQNEAPGSSQSEIPNPHSETPSSTPHSALRTPHSPSSPLDTHHSSLVTLADSSSDPSLRNELANELTRDPAQHAALADTLLAAWNDPEQPAVWQDYALQHLGNLAALHPDDPRLTDTLWQAAELPRHTHASTALLGLLQQESQHPRVREAALKLAADPNATPGNRATALQILLSLEDPQALPIARGILDGGLRIAESSRVISPTAQNAASGTPQSPIPNPQSPIRNPQSIPLRLSALAVLGQLGDASDLPLLASYHQNPISPLRNAARAATTRISPTNVSPGN